MPSPIELAELQRRADSAAKSGDFAQAIALAGQVIAADFRQPASHVTLGQAQLALGDLAAARQSFGTALVLDQSRIEAHLGLIRTSAATGDLATTQALLANALQLAPGHGELRFQAGLLLQQLRNPVGAVQNYALALRADPQSQRYRIAFSSSLQGMRLPKPDAGLIELILPLLGEPGIDPHWINGIVEPALLHDPRLARLLPPADAAAPDLPIGLEADDFPALGEMRLLLAWLSHGFTSEPRLEQVYTLLRRAALPLALHRPEALTRHRRWLAALALRNFLAEYVDAESDAEQAGLAGLDALIAQDIAAEKLPAPERLLLYGCYRPLAGRDDAANLAVLDWPMELAELKRRQLDEPLAERRIAAALPAYTAIDDAVSQTVREMYEESPFPRWDQPLLPPSQTVAMRLRSRLPRCKLPPLEIDAPRVLIAGSGTGMQAIIAALAYHRCDVLALDLSRASLAYGKRKADELGFSNIRFGQADILKVGQLQDRFDVIESFGVLHHMRDPAAGLAQLVQLLKPGGVMLLGLYSEVARRDVVAARDLIARCGFGDSPAEIRRFRAEVEQLDPVLGGRLKHFSAFHAMSDLRDLLFHRQEHRYTPQQLGELIAGSGLRFLGFDLQQPGMLEAYAAAYPEDTECLDFAHWAEFEQQHPSLFANCFRFWLHKPLS
ncbi:methyltransferase domain-containing protein [Ferrovibrio sp.]|uniref:class I SAM-dependent methyltransferase n=1 Tax=Ferrovibrio sp. TaxID=1917215 RepID=UPI003D0FFED1